MSSERQSAEPIDPASAGGGRALRQRQRQRLIDACISALHLYGPSRTTVEKVVAIADLSPGIVRFYFDSKDAMLVASLAHLAAEFDQRVLAPLASLKASPVRALQQLVELYFDPEIASPRKVSVWYSFWGEASSRQEYQDICGRKDEDFAALVRELVGALILQTGARHLDADAVSLGLIGVLEVLWQGIAFQSESNIDRDAARRRSLAYLASVFPGMFPPARKAEAAPAASTAARTTGSLSEGADASLPAWVYGSAPLLAIERERLLRPAWQMVGHADELAAAGDYLTASWPWERALVIRAARGELHALRNACRHQPHALLEARSGHVAGKLHCAVHDLMYDLAGRRLSGSTPGDLTPLELLRQGPLLMVRSGAQGASSLEASLMRTWPKLSAGRIESRPAAADWKLIVEQWLERESPRRWFLAPNQLLDLDIDPPRLLQVVPEAPGRSRLVQFELGRARRASRRGRLTAGEGLEEQIALAESTQAGLAALPMQPAASVDAAPALARFRQSIAALLPLLVSGSDTGA
ncbi:MAG: Rieske 2Fe-2S domain-containing protein [Proteobacteria bacterium]|nr:Rieske 2Fe-2S domain-containing protein [Pseudomonadota bacterium]